MDIKRAGSQPSAKGPADYFTGSVRIDAPFAGSIALSGASVTFEPGEKHWHGASRSCAVSHIAIAEKRDGKVVTWLEHVTDEQYDSEAL